MNKAILVGALGGDPEIRYMTNGTAAVNFSMATSEMWKDKNTGTQQEKTEWHRVVAFGKLAEIIGQNLQKGAKVYVEGKIKTRKWQDASGQDRYTTEVVASDVSFLSAKSDGQSQRGQEVPQAQGGHSQDPPPLEQGNFSDFDDDIPF